MNRGGYKPPKGYPQGAVSTGSLITGAMIFLAMTFAVLTFGFLMEARANNFSASNAKAGGSGYTRVYRNLADFMLTDMDTNRCDVETNATRVKFPFNLITKDTVTSGYAIVLPWYHDVLDTTNRTYAVAAEGLHDAWESFKATDYPGNAKYVKVGGYVAEDTYGDGTTVLRIRVDIHDHPFAVVTADSYWLASSDLLAKDGECTAQVYGSLRKVVVELGKMDISLSMDVSGWAAGSQIDPLTISFDSMTVAGSGKGLLTGIDGFTLNKHGVVTFVHTSDPDGEWHRGANPYDYAELDKVNIYELPA